MSIFYVSNTGRNTNAGTLTSPLDWVTIITKGISPVKPGDVVLIMPGTFYGKYNITLEGSALLPIIFKKQIEDSRVIFDSSTVNNNKNQFQISGAFLHFFGIEVTSSHPKRVSSQTGSWPTDIWQGTGIDIKGPGIKFVNCIVHDNAQGFGFWNEAPDSEIYGCIIYNNGWDASDRAHGHGIYVQNNTGTKIIENNIIFNQFNSGIEAYGTSNSFLRGISARHNVCFNNGVNATDADGVDIMLGGGAVIENCFVIDNIAFRGFKTTGGVSIFGHSVLNNSLTVTDNYFNENVKLTEHQKLNFLRNTVIHSGTLIQLNQSFPSGSLKLDGNKYFWGGNYKPFGWGTAAYDFNQWKVRTNQESTSTFTSGSPTLFKIKFIKNKYDPKIGHLTVVNWKKQNWVQINLSSVVAPGKRYEIRNVQDLFGNPVLSGVYVGGEVRVPMIYQTYAKAYGLENPPFNNSTEPIFQSFVVKQL